MSKHLHIALMVLVVSCAGVSRAQEAEHYFAFWGEGGAALALAPAAQAKPQIGAGGGLGLGYEFNYYRFIMQLGMHANTTYERLAPDQDYFHYVSLQTPLLFGGEFNHLYFLTGGKFQLNIVTDNPQMDEDAYLFSYDALACAEIGLNWTLQQYRYTKPKIRLALYADYGVLSSRLQAGLKLTFLFGGKAHENHVCRVCPDYQPFR